MSTSHEVMSWTAIPFDEWRAKCNGSEAYSDFAPAMLSVAVVRETRLLARIAELEAQQTDAPVNVPSLTDDEIVRVLHSLAIDTYPSKYGFPERQVSATNVPMIRKIVAAYLAAAPSPVEQTEAQPKASYPTMTLNGYQLKDALGFIAPDDTAEQLEMDVSIAILPSDKAPLDDDNKRMPAGVYAWITDYPEEGCIPLLEEPKSTAQPAPEAQQSERDAIQVMLALHTRMLETNPYCYFELAYTRHTGWMAWLCTNSREHDENRKVIAKGQGDTPDDACRNALSVIAKEQAKS